jgi:SAM-dependent methyltransferase
MKTPAPPAAGSNRETPYTSLYFPQQSPVSINYLARRKNLSAAAIDQPFRYLDLGCGNGVTVNTLAAASPHGIFHGVDLMPEHIASARREAENGELGNVYFHELYFRELLKQDLPQFDYIALHGVYSWVSDQERRDIREVISRLLKPYGLVYVSYNTLPGSAVLAPLRDMFKSYADTLSGDLIERAREGLKYLKHLKDNDALYIKSNPIVGAMIDTMLTQDIRYIAHEYLADHHSAIGVVDLAADLAKISLKICSGARLGPTVAQRAQLSKFQGLLDSRPDDLTREALKSVIWNEKYRADIFCRRQNIAEEVGSFGDFSDTVFGAARLTIWRSKSPPEELSADVGEIFNALSLGMSILANLGNLSEFQSYAPEVLTDLVHHLVSDGHLRPFARRAVTARSQAGGPYRIASPFNRASLANRLATAERVFLASPVLGDGLAVDLISGLFLRAVGEAQADDPVAHVNAALKARKRAWRRDGVTVKDSTERLMMLKKEYKTFRHDTLPLLQRLGIIAGGPA